MRYDVAEGGSQAIADALAADVEQHGGIIETGRTVTSVGDLPPSDVLMLDVSPSIAADILGDRLPARVARAYRRFRHGPGAFKVDFAVEEVAKGIPRFEAVIDAGRKRARPIVMTTLVMVAGMVPSAMALGDGGEFRAPMAIAVIGGLLVSTVLSLVFVPSFYTVMDDIGRLVWWILGRFIGPTDESPEYLAEQARQQDAHAPPPHPTPAE